MGGDCSQRVCPFGLSFVDTPLGDLNHDGDVSDDDAVKTQLGNAVMKEMFPTTAHSYAECSNKGFCDRASGECGCFDGYTGSACQRTVCPNDCSGHGQCYTLREIAAGPNVAVTHPADSTREVGRNFKVLDYQFGFYKTSGVSDKFEYNLWDADKNQACVCDAGFFGPDCSLRQCPKGNDPLTNDPKHCGGTTCASEVQYMYIAFDTNGDDTDYYLEWEDKEQNSGLLTKLRSEIFTVKKGLTGDDYAELLQDAIETFPNGALNGVSVSCNQFHSSVNIAVDAHVKCSTPLAINNALELKLDYTNGPQGSANGISQHVVRAKDIVTNIEMDKVVGIAVKAASTPSSETPNQASADFVARNGLSYTGTPVNPFILFGTGFGTPAAGNQENSPCSNRGLCDYSTGTCTCFAGYTREDCSVQNALAM